MQIGMTSFDSSAKRRPDLVVIGFPRHAKNVVMSLHLYPPNRWPVQQKPAVPQHASQANRFLQSGILVTLFESAQEVIMWPTLEITLWTMRRRNLRVFHARA
jgi:hypothetical protein